MGTEKKKNPDAELQVISPAEAGAKAEAIIRETGMKEWPQCQLLNDPNVERRLAFRVEEETRTEGGAAKQTYIVPYGIKDEHDDEGTPLTRMCILLDGTTGKFEEETTFGEPITYLSQEKAIGIVAHALGLQAMGTNSFDATLMFDPGPISHVRAYPFWKVVVSGHDYYVDQTGKFYDELKAEAGKTAG